MAVIDRDVDGVLARLVEFELLDVDDEITDEEIGVRRNHHIDRHIDARHDQFAVFIHEIHFYFVGPFLDAVEGNAQRDGTLRMNGRKLAGDDRVEGSQQVQFTAVIGGGVTKDSDLNGHTSGDEVTAEVWSGKANELHRNLI